MKFLGNLIWLIFGGLFTAIVWFFTGLLWCITIVGIPIGLQYFKFAGLMLTPFGNKVKINFDKHPILNIIWLIIFGWGLALSYLFFGVILSITIIGIPFGLQFFKLAKLALLPIGAEVI